MTVAPGPGVHPAVSALRGSVAYTHLPWVAAVRVSGTAAFAAVDRLCPRELFLRDGQVLHTLLLDEDARPTADLYVAADDGTFVLLAEGMSPPELVAAVREAGGSSVEAHDLGESHSVLSLDGPYAWELLAEVAGPEVIGQPYMTWYGRDGTTSLRAGKTGEFGYWMLLPTALLPAFTERLLERGRDFDLMEADLDALDQCALESFVFNPRRDAPLGVTPVELQLQWRVSRTKSFRGAAALAARRTSVQRRLTLCAVGGAVTPGDVVEHAGTAIGTVVNAGWCEPRREWVATALLDRALAHPRISAFTVARQDGRLPLTTLAAPALNNRSLFVNPQLHSYRTRAEVEFPPLVAPP